MEKGITMPAPMPRMQLITMSHIMLRAKRHATPLRKKIDSPTAKVLSLSLPTESLPASQDEGDDQQRGQRREHLYFEVGGLREDFI